VLAIQYRLYRDATVYSLKLLLIRFEELVKARQNFSFRMNASCSKRNTHTAPPMTLGNMQGMHTALCCERQRTPPEARRCSYPFDNSEEEALHRLKLAIALVHQFSAGAPY
jgi:hypothetical protein